MATIMVVDDEESLRELIIALFGQEGYKVIAVSSGQECLDALKAAKPDLILMDMMMPGMSGRETTERIRQNPETKDLKIAFLTAERFSESGKGTLTELRVLDYIPKPFDNEELVKKVKRFAEQ